MERFYENGFREFIDGALNEESNKRYTCACVLYWKAMMKICDFLFFKEKGVHPKHLQERLNFLRDTNEGIMKIIGENAWDAGTPYYLYNDAYKTQKDEKDCEVFRNAIKKIVKRRGIKGEIKKISKTL